MKTISLLFAASSLLISFIAKADVVVPMHLVTEKGIGASVGQVTITESSYGLVFTPALGGLPPGLHGFHVHQNPDCQPKEKDGKMVAALSAGGHYDPKDTNHHATPWDDGHMGDLPPIFVDSNGNATEPVLAPRLKMADVKERSLMIHVGGDNFADQPLPLGGGGARMVCGVMR